MPLKNVSFEQLSKNIQENNTKLKLHIIPYGISPNRDGDVYYPFLHHSINEFMVPFDGSIDNNTNLKMFVSNKIREETMGALDFEPELVETNTNTVVESLSDENSTDQYQWAVMWVFTGIVGFQNINNVLRTYVKNFKTTIRLHSYMNNFDTNLVYITAEELYYLANNDVYIISDGVNEYEVDVSSGMILDQNIKDIYMLKRGDIPVSELQLGTPNAPFQKRIYNEMLPDISKRIVSILDDNSIDSFFTRNYRSVIDEEFAEEV